jgi:hypothetical protein
MVAVMTDLQVSLTGINIKLDQLWSSEDTGKVAQVKQNTIIKCCDAV